MQYNAPLESYSYVDQPAKKILIVDDDQAIREMMSTVLELEGYEVSLAENGRDGIESIRCAGTPDVILLDMMMPVMSGWDFLDVMRSDAQYSVIPVIVVSAYQEIARSVKPKAVVYKPVQLAELLQAIESCVA